jgi:hypothetical protein
MGTKFVDVPVMPCQDGYCQPPVSQRSITEGRTREITKIRELGTVLAGDSLVALDDRARALGLSRSTAWAILKRTTRHQVLEPGRSIECSLRPSCPARAGDNF